MLMKKVYYFFTGLLVAAACVVGMTGCQEKLDLNNIDTQMKAEMGLAMPAGTMLFTANDFLGGGRVKNVSIDKDGIFHIVHEAQMDKVTYKKPDVSKYISKMEDVFYIKKQLDSIYIPELDSTISILDENGYVLDTVIVNIMGFPVKVPVKGRSLPVSFTKTLRLKDINVDPDKQMRLDKAEVKAAIFNSIIDQTNMDGMLWSYIDTATITFNSQFTIAGGNTVTVYKKGDKGGYGQKIDFSVNDFTLNLMKDLQKDPGWDNVVDTIVMNFNFRFTVPVGKDLQITDKSGFIYTFEAKKIDYSAIYGEFFTTETSSSRQSISIDSLVGSGWKDLKEMQIKFMEPSINVGIAHHMSIPMYATVNEFKTINKEQQTQQATWGGSITKKFNLDNVISPDDDPTKTALNVIRMNQDPDSGNLDTLFLIRPDSVVLSLTSGVNRNSTYPYKQHRVTDQDTIYTSVDVDLPFKLNQESAVRYVGKSTKLQFDKFTIDSLLREVKGVESGKAKTLKLFMEFTNSMPFEVDAQFWFLRKDSTRMNVSIMGGKENRIVMPAAKTTLLPGETYGKVTEPSKNTVIIDLNEQQLDSLSQNAKLLEFDAFMGKNTEPCVLDTATSFKVGFGLAASVEAIINPKKK